MLLFVYKNKEEIEYKLILKINVLIFLATEYHLGLLKAKLAKYRSQLLEPSKKSGEKGEGFDVLKSGDARVALIGFPSVGKVRLNFNKGKVEIFPTYILTLFSVYTIEYPYQDPK